MNCWEYKKCGREKGGINVKKLGICPAWPAHGRQCARVAGTFCGGKVQGTFVMKLLTCMKCGFYQSEHYDKSYGRERAAAWMAAAQAAYWGWQSSLGISTHISSRLDREYQRCCRISPSYWPPCLTKTPGRAAGVTCRCCRRSRKPANSLLLGRLLGLACNCPAHLQFRSGHQIHNLELESASIDTRFLIWPR